MMVKARCPPLVSGQRGHEPTGQSNTWRESRRVRFLFHLLLVCRDQLRGADRSRGAGSGTPQRLRCEGATRASGERAHRAHLRRRGERKTLRSSAKQNEGGVEARGNAKQFPHLKLISWQCRSQIRVFMKILFVGDIFGNAGRRALAEHLARLMSEHKADLCIANGENAAGGWGLTAAILKKLHKYGVHVVTGGNHSFANQEILPAFESDPALVRPLNFPPGNPGKGSTVYTLADGRKVGVLNLQGRTFFAEALDCPFRLGTAAIEDLRTHTHIIVVDFHAEASSEKIAFAQHVDGTVGAVVGTHTHVQTADERVLAGGTAFITDVGMTGPEESAIGMKTKGIIRRFLLQSPVRFEPSSDGPMINAVLLEIDDTTGKAVSIARIFERVRFS